MTKWISCMIIVLSIAVNMEAKELTVKEQNKQQWFHLATVGDVITTMIGAGCVAVREVNPMLNGASPVGIAGFFVARNIAHEYITKELIPDTWRAQWQNSWIGAQTLIVINNVHVIAKHC